MNRGVMSSSIMAYLDWDRLGKRFCLLDTCRGLDERPVSPGELEEGILKKNSDLIESGFYVVGADSVRRNFAEWRNVSIIEGIIPDSRAGEGELDRVPAPRLELRATGSGGPEVLLSRGWRNDAVDLLVCFETIEQVDQQQEPAQPLRPPDSGGPA